MCQPPRPEVQGFSTLGTTHSIIPHPQRAAPWDEYGSYGVRIQLTPHSGRHVARRVRPSERDRSPPRHASETAVPSPLPDTGPNSAGHVASLQERAHASSSSSGTKIVYEGGSTTPSSSTSSSSASPGNVAATSMWRSRCQRYRPFAPKHRELELRCQSQKISRPEPPSTPVTYRNQCHVAAGGEAGESSAEEMLLLEALDRGLNEKPGTLGQVEQGARKETNKGQRAECSSLERKLELISLQRSVSAAKCEIFLDYLEHHQKEGKSPIHPAQSAFNARASADSHRQQGPTGTRSPASQSGRKRLSKGLAGAGSKSFHKSGFRKFPTPLHIPGEAASPQHHASRQVSMSAANTPRGRFLPAHPEASPFPMVPLSCRLRNRQASYASPRKPPMAAEWVAPDSRGHIGQLLLSASMTPLRKESVQRCAQAKEAFELFGGEVNLDSSDDSDDERSDSGSDESWCTCEGAAAGADCTCLGCSAGFKLGASGWVPGGGESGLWLVPKQTSRFSREQHVPILPLQ